MSIKAMTWAFELAQLPSMEKLVLLTLADDANNDGLAYRQNIGVIATKSTMSGRTVCTHLRSLENRGLILTISNWYVGEDGRKYRSHNMYLLNVDARLVNSDDGLVADRAIEANDILAELSLGKTAGDAISAKFAGMNDQAKCQGVVKEAKNHRKITENPEGKTAGRAISAKSAGMNDQQKQVNAVEPVDKPVDEPVSYRQTVAGIDQLTQELNYPPYSPPTG